MKWKKVSEYPLPDGDGEKLYIMKFKDVYSRYDDFKLTSNFHPKRINLEGLSVLEWCEFNPDEIESADDKLKDAIVGEDFKWDEPTIDNVLHQVPIVKKSVEELKKEYSAPFTDYTLQQGHAPIEFQGSGEPSWEEKFRWETAAKAMSALIIHQRHYEDLGSSPPRYEVVAKMSAEYSDTLIKELKRGRE